MKRTNTKTISAAILSLSLLTVMAGAAVAPALGVIKVYFADCDQLFTQMIISMPAVFIVLTNLIFSRLASRFGSRSLLLAGLIFYTVGGCAAGLFDTIIPVLAMRALVGIGVGILMPLSTGLLAFYFPPEQQEKLMGYSSAMNQMGGVVATLLAGLLAGISWRASFLVYLMGLISVVLVLLFLPNDCIRQAGSGTAVETKQRPQDGHVLRENYAYIIALFLLMSTFFLYPANFAIVTVSEGIIPARFLSVIMAGMDLVAFFGGLLFVAVKKLCGSNTRFFAPALFILGYILLIYPGGWIGTLFGSAFIGFANGCGIPYILSAASQAAGKSAITTVMPLLSMALYLAQFLNPLLLSAIIALVGAFGVAGASSVKLPYCAAIVIGVLLILWSSLIREKRPV